MHVLLIEDSPRLQRSITIGLRNAGYAVDSAADGEEGLLRAQVRDFDVIVLDLMLPKLDGLTVLRWLREHRQSTYVLILTAKDTVEDRVTGLQAGADDYLVKPFAFEELLARIQALVRRRYAQKSPSIRLSDLEINTSSKTVTVGGNPVTLTRREYALLEYLANRPGVVVSRRDIETHLYEDSAELMSNVVDSAIYALRRKIDSPGRPSRIQTRRGLGYVLRPEEP